MTLYALSIVLFFVWFATVDAERTMKDNSPTWITLDWVYLFGLAVCFLYLVMGAHYYTAQHFLRFTLANMLIGSEVEDCLYGQIVEHDPLFPFDDWAFGIGFSGKKYRRVIFDIVRISGAIVLFNSK